MVIQETMKTIDAVTKAINEGTVTRGTLAILDVQSQQLRSVVDKVKQDPEQAAKDFQINPTKLEEDTNRVKEDVSSAIREVDEQLGPDTRTISAVVIAVGVVGGLTAVVLAAKGGNVAFKKYQQRKKQQSNKTDDNILEESGQTNPALELEEQQSTPSQPA